MMSEEDNWINNRTFTLTPYTQPIPSTVIGSLGESLHDRKLRMLIPLSHTCLACSLCDLGLKVPVHGHIGRDPHILSNMKPNTIAFVGMNPDKDCIINRRFLSDDVGKLFDRELKNNGKCQNDFYITNLVKCYSDDVVSSYQLKTCRFFIKTEFELIKPKLVVAFGKTVFSELCPGVDFDNSIMKITDSVELGVKVIGLQSPEILLSDNCDNFRKGLRVICKLC